MGPDKGHLLPKRQGVPGCVSPSAVGKSDRDVPRLLPSPVLAAPTGRPSSHRVYVALGFNLVMAGLTGVPASAVVDTTNHVTQTTPYYTHKSTYRQPIRHNSYHTDTTITIPHMHIYSHLCVDVICTQLAHTTHMNSLIAQDPPTLYTNHMNTCVTAHTVLIRHTHTGLHIPLTHKYSYTLFHTHHNIDYTETFLPHTIPYLYVNI